MRFIDDTDPVISLTKHTSSKTDFELKKTSLFALIKRIVHFMIYIVYISYLWTMY